MAFSYLSESLFGKRERARQVIRSQVFANLVWLFFNMKAGTDSVAMPSCQRHIK